MRASRVLLAEDHPSLAAAIGEYVAEAFHGGTSYRARSPCSGDTCFEAAVGAEGKCLCVLVGRSRLS